MDANAYKEHLHDLAKDAGTEGRSTMTKDALPKSNDRKTTQAQEK